MNIIVIVSDTFRRDHLGCYGNTTVRTPHLDDFARSEILFDNFHHASFPTMPMRADLFTGRYTFTYLGWAPLPVEERILAAELRTAGYETLAAVDTPFLQRRGYGYDRGFRDFNLVRGQGDDEERGRMNSERRYEEDYITPRTIATAERLLEYYYRKKFFLYVDLWDPHEPWDPPRWYVEPFLPGYDGRIVQPVYWYYKERGITEEDIRVAHACYCGEISMVDRWVGRLLEKVRDMGLWDDTAILFTSDHGYYFGEHGQFGKGLGVGEHWIQSPLYREITRVPLILHVPGMAARRQKAMVSAVDLMPTILELAGVQPPSTVHGASILPMLRQGSDHGREFTVSSFPLYNPGEPSRIVDDWLRTVDQPHFSTVSTPEWTLLYSTESFPAQLYDVREDPGESKNVIADHGSVAERLHAGFVSVLEQAGTHERYLSLRRKLTLG